MNKNLFYLLSGLLLAGCSAAELEQPNTTDQGGKQESVTSYLNLRVVSPPQTRDAQFENGTPQENAVTRVRFYFFDGDGYPAPVWENTASGTYNSYQDWFPTSSDAKPGTTGTVEKIYNVTLGLKLPGNLSENQPALVLAVLNPTSELLALTPSNSVSTGTATLTVNGPSLETLRTTVSDYRTGLMSSGSFVMSNSVYVENSKIIDATVIEDSNFGVTEEDAEQTSITIYVERVLARVDLELALTNSSVTVGDNTYYQVGSYNVYSGDEGASEENIYVQLLGWNVTGTPNASRLVKLVDAGWTNGSVFGTGTLEPWTSPDYHRSYWGVNPLPSSFEYLYGNFETSPSSTPTPFPAIGPAGFSDSATSVYVQENANAYNIGSEGEIEAEGPAYPTKVIIAAKLVDSEGNTFPMAEWNYYKYTLPQMKIQIAKSLTNLFKRTQSGTTYTYTPISADDFTFQTAQQLEMTDTDNPDYYVYPVLTTDAEDYTWTLGEGTDASVLDIDAVNTYLLDNIHHVMVWENGLTYYFFDIKHIGNEGSAGYYGIVRNHIYYSKLTSLAGLGTPVYDPTQTIYPEETENESNIVTADIEILQWRLIVQEYNLTWP